MSAPAIISGDLTTFKHVPTRKVYQLIVEIPAEAASAAFATLGMPGAVSQIPVAVARLDPQASAQVEGPRANRRMFSDMPLPQQAALRCQESEFKGFLVDTGRLRLLNATTDDVADVVRQLCGVTSRSDIGKGPNDRSANDSGFKWRALDAEYYAWQRGRR